MHTQLKIAGTIQPQSSTIVVGTIAFDAESSNGRVDTVTTYSWTHTCEDNVSDLFVGVYVTLSSSTGMVAKYDTVPMLLVGSDVQQHLLCMFHKSSPSPGTHSISIDSPTTTTFLDGVATSYKTGGYTGNSNITTEDTTQFRFGASVGYDNGWLLGLFRCGHTTVSVLGTDGTIIRSHRGPIGIVDSNRKLTIGTQLLSLQTSDSTSWLGIAVAIL